MLDNWISVWETALSAAREAHDNYASGKVFHSAMAALRKIGGNQNISDSELEQEITSPPYSFGLNASLLEDFALRVARHLGRRNTVDL